MELAEKKVPRFYLVNRWKAWLVGSVVKVGDGATAMLSSSEAVDFQ
jgi:hypothetical protein